MEKCSLLTPLSKGIRQKELELKINYEGARFFADQQWVILLEEEIRALRSLLVGPFLMKSMCRKSHGKQIINQKIHASYVKTKEQLAGGGFCTTTFPR
ncbi:hypothetical protein NPIL_398841 [Nephila pilipes]|uniref:Uncharacterized protein n=1 Tax=Nephila pilipes TaxID=299642 RepID=A0A8X6UWZ6_NEPPI|nr:hypothetical protein NPIL_398841 [Nephila pilipes]